MRYRPKYYQILEITHYVYMYVSCPREKPVVHTAHFINKKISQCINYIFTNSILAKTDLQCDHFIFYLS